MSEATREVLKCRLKKVEISGFRTRPMDVHSAGELRMAASDASSTGVILDSRRIDGVTFVFGAYRLDTRTKRLLRGDAVVPLTTKAFDTLEVLVRAAGQTVSKDDLLKQVWPGTFVQEDTLAQNISTIRRALEETADSPRHVLTVPRDGYRFVAPVEVFKGEVLKGGAKSESLPLQQTAATQSRSGKDVIRAGRSLDRFILAATSGAIVVTLALMWLRAPVSNARPPLSVAFEIFEPEGTRFSSSGGAITLSPDGRHLAFLAEDADGQDHLWIRTMSSRESTLMPGTADASQPFWSADGRSIAFFSRGALRSIELSGGQLHTVCQLPFSAPGGFAGSWSANDLIMFSLQGKGLFQVLASGGDATLVQVPGRLDCSACLWPFFLPDGRNFLFTIVSRQTDRGIYIGSLDGAPPRLVLDAVSSSAYTTDGYLVHASGGALVARRFDPVRGQITGDARPIADRVWSNPFTARAVFSTSEGGLVAYREPPVTRLRWISRAGDVISTGPEAIYHSFSVSPTGRVLASELDPRLGTYGLWLHDRDWRTTSRLTFEHTSDLRPLWSDDETRAAFARDGGSNGWQLYELDIARPGAERPLLAQASSDSLTPIAWRDDVLYYTASAPGASPQLMIPTGRTDRPTAIAAHGAGPQGRLSPDGGWLAYTVNVNDSRVPQAALFVRPWPSGPGRSQIAPEGSLPRWRADGAELFFMRPGGHLMAAPLKAGRTMGPPVDLGPTHALATSGLAGQAYDAAPDGQRFLVKVPAQRQSIVVLSGWAAVSGR